MKPTLLLFAASFFALVLHAAEPAKKPNIIFILADDLGYGDIGSFGQKIIQTPTLDKLAGEGMRFTQHYAGSPVCAPSRCVLLTGQHPGHAFVRDNFEIGTWYSFQGQLPLPATQPSIAAALKSASYATGAFGKWGLGGVGSPGDPLKQGFDHFFGFNCQRHAHNYYPQYLVDGEGKSNSNPRMHGYKGDIYEGGMREPLIVRWKGHVPASATSDFVSGFEDWFPTLLDLAGAANAKPEHLDGISLAPTLLGGKQPERPFLYREFHGSGGQQSVRVGGWKLLKRNLLGTPDKPAAPTTELYNLATDPAEKENLAAAHPGLVAKLAEIMRRQHAPSKEFPMASLDHRGN